MPPAAQTFFVCLYRPIGLRLVGRPRIFGSVNVAKRGFLSSLQGEEIERIPRGMEQRVVPLKKAKSNCQT